MNKLTNPKIFEKNRNKKITARSGRKPSQSAYELLSLIDILKHLSIKSYCEIGARDGDTFYDIVKAINNKNIVALAVDLPGGNWGKPTTRLNLEDCSKQLKSEGYINTSILFGDSSTDATKKIIKGRISNYGKYDAIFIDGDHTLIGVTKDFNNYKDLSDVLIFHDIVGVNEICKKTNLKVEVPIFWNNLVNNNNDYLYIELIDKNSTMGIGVAVNKNSKYYDKIIELVNGH